MKFKLTTSAIYEFGQRKDAAGNPHQEDSLYPQEHVQQPGPTDSRLFIVCDGMGGHDAGEVASATVCEALSRSILRRNTAEGPFTDNDLRQAVADAYDALDVMDTGAAKKMGTTLTLLKLHEAGYTIAHMGDSRVYHIRPGKDREHTRIVHVTSDHSLVNDLLKIGELTPETAKTYPRKNVITRAMQPNMERRSRPEIYRSSDIRPGDYFFLCSDGMLEQTEDDNLCYFFSNEVAGIDKKTALLTDITRDNRDNHTAIIVRVDSVEGEAVDTTATEGMTIVAERVRLNHAETAETTPPQAPERDKAEETTQPAAPEAKDEGEEEEEPDSSLSERMSNCPLAPYFSAYYLRKAIIILIALLLVALILVGKKQIAGLLNNLNKDKTEQVVDPLNPQPGKTLEQPQSPCSRQEDTLRNQPPMKPV